MKSKILSIFIILCISAVALLFAHGNMTKATIGFLKITKNLTITAAGLFNAGSDGNGIDVQFFTDTATEEFLWDASANGLFLDGTNAANVLTLTDGNLSVTDDVDINGVLTTDGINRSGVIVVDATPYAVLAANTGMIHLIAVLSQDTSIDLPAEAAGLNYEFWFVGGADDGDDHTIDTENNTNFFIGGVAFADTDAGAGGDEINAGIYSDGNSNSRLIINNFSAGTVIKVTCDGTNWYVTGVVYSDTAPTFSDQ